MNSDDRPVEGACQNLLVLGQQMVRHRSEMDTVLSASLHQGCYVRTRVTSRPNSATTTAASEDIKIDIRATASLSPMILPACEWRLMAELHMTQHKWKLYYHPDPCWSLIPVMMKVFSVEWLELKLQTHIIIFPCLASSISSLIIAIIIMITEPLS